MEFNDYQAMRLSFTLEMLLEFANEKLRIFEGFELPVDSREKINQGMRISLDLWESPALVDMFTGQMKGYCDEGTYNTVCGFRHSLRGPFYVAESDAYTARLMYGGTVFEVQSAKRTWEDMVPYMPDIVYTTIVPFEGAIASDVFVIRHGCHMEGPGKARLARTYRKALEKGVVSDANQFIDVAERLNNERRQGLMEPECAQVMLDIVDQVNSGLFGVCPPYKMPVCEIPKSLRG